MPKDPLLYFGAGCGFLASGSSGPLWLSVISLIPSAYCMCVGLKLMWRGLCGHHTKLNP
jgi:hypothetical protein